MSGTNRGCLGLKHEKDSAEMLEHFSEILNREDPKNPVEEDEIVESEEIEEIERGRWRLQEFKDTLKRIKPGEAAGVEEVCPK